MPEKNSSRTNEISNKQKLCNKISALKFLSPSLQQIGLFPPQTTPYFYFWRLSFGFGLFLSRVTVLLSLLDTHFITSCKIVMCTVMSTQIPSISFRFSRSNWKNGSFLLPLYVYLLLLLSSLSLSLLSFFSIGIHCLWRSSVLSC